MKVITYEDIRKINETYARLGTYAATSRELGFSPTTIKKYINKDFSLEEKQIIRFEKPLPEFDPLKFLEKDWSLLCELTQEELDEIKELWKELDV